LISRSRMAWRKVSRTIFCKDCFWMGVPRII
jgi:hypothetical protein